MAKKRIARLLVGVLLGATLTLGFLLWWVRWHYAPERDAREVLGWLPPDTETAIVLGGPFPLEAPGKSIEDSLPACLQDLASSILSWVQEGEFLQELRGRTVRLCVEGSRRFTSPDGLGLMPYEGATIIIFETALGWTGYSLTRAMASKAKEVKDFGGARVACFEEKLEGDVWRLFIGVPRGNVLVLGTHEGFVEEVLRRLARNASKPVLQEHLEDGLSRANGARSWVSRRYERSTAERDPTSPFQENPVVGDHDAQARGLRFAYDPVRMPIARITYLSDNQDAVAIATRFWRHPGEGLDPTIRVVAPGEVEISLPCDSPEEVYGFYFFLLAALGHGIFL